MFYVTAPHLQDRWTKQTEFGAELETSELLAAIVRMVKPKVCFESGTAWGDTAEKIGQALKANGAGVLYSCDTDDEKVAHSRKRLERLPVEVIQTPGIEFIQSWNDGFDFAFIDSWWCPVRTEELLAIGHKMKPGAFLALHDACQNYGPCFDDFQSAFGWQNMIFMAPYGLGLWQAPVDWETVKAKRGKMVTFHEQ